MPTTLHKIELPSLVNSNFGVNLKNVFENIDSNFQKLSSLGLTTGASGKPSVWIPYNLNAAFCTQIANGTLQSTYLPSSVLEQIREDYLKYQEITNNSPFIYVMECILMYEDMLKAIHTDVDTNNDPITISYNDDDDNEHYWKQKWENDVCIDINYLYIDNETTSYHLLYDKLLNNTELKCSHSVTENDIKLIKEYVYNQDTQTEGTYLPFLPGTIMVAGNYEETTGKFTKLGTLSHIYIDPRFRSPYVISGKLEDEQLIQLEGASDQSCVVYGTGYYSSDIKDYELKFEHSYVFPRIHCQDGEFYLKVNDIATNIPLTGRTGKAGKDSKFAIVRLAETSEGGTDIDLNTYHSIVNNSNYGQGTYYKVGNTIPDSNSWDTQKSTYDGCPAIVFPNTSFANNSYTTAYWMSHLKFDEETGDLTAYCGRENLVEVSLYDHSFAGMMMGLDVYEQSIANPAGNTPWYKPRGLMLPIGARRVDSGVWIPKYNGESSSNASENFSAHLIYSTGSSNTNKRELHISSVADYRKIGGVETSISEGASAPYVPGTHNSSIVSGTKLFIDEPVEITNYQTSNYRTSDPLLNIPFGYERIRGYDDSGWGVDKSGFIIPGSSAADADACYTKIKSGSKFKNQFDNSSNCLIPGTGNTFNILYNGNLVGNRMIDPRFDGNQERYAQALAFYTALAGKQGISFSPDDFITTITPPAGSTGGLDYWGGKYHYTRGINYGKLSNYSASDNYGSDYAVGGYGKDFDEWSLAVQEGGLGNHDASNKGFGLQVDHGIRTKMLSTQAIGTRYIYNEKLISTKNLIAKKDNNGKGGNVLASHFVKENAEDGQILLANGYATIPQKPIRLLYQKGDGSQGQIEFEIKNTTGTSISDGNAVFRNSNGNRLVTGDLMTYVGSNKIEIKNKQTTISSCVWTFGNSDYCDTSYNTSAINGALNNSDISFNATTSGLFGGVVVFKSGNIVNVRVLLAANGKDFNISNDNYFFGLPITSNKEGKTNKETARFKNYKIGTLPDISNIPCKPLYDVNQYWSAQTSYVSTRGTGANDYLDDKVMGENSQTPFASLGCKIDTNGDIYLSGANCMFAFSCINPSKDEYIEFNFIYPTALVTGQQTPAHYVYTGELDVETGKPVNTDMTDTSVWHLVDEYEGSTGDITYEIVAKQNPEADLDTDAKPTEFNTESEEWTFEPYVEPDPDPIVLNYIYTGAMRHGIPAILDMTDSTVWFKADEFEGATSDIAARITATHEGSRDETRIPEPRTYGKNSDGWTFEITLEPHTHYWKCEGDDLPEDGTEITGRLPQTISLDPSISITAYSIDSIPSEWYEDTEIWNLISVGATTKDLTNYNVYYNTENAEAGITAESWLSSPVKPGSNITFQWLGGHGYDIVSYLKQTQLAWSHNGYWQGPLFDIFKPANFSNGKTYTYEGFRGKVEVSQYRESSLATTWYGDMTIECWNSDLSARIYDHYTISYDAVQTSQSGRLDVNDKVISMRGSMKGEIHNGEVTPGVTPGITPGEGQLKPNTPSDGNNGGSGTTPIDPSIGGGTVRP